MKRDSVKARRPTSKRQDKDAAQRALWAAKMAEWIGQRVVSRTHAFAGIEGCAQYGDVGTVIEVEPGEYAVRWDRATTQPFGPMVFETDGIELIHPDYIGERFFAADATDEALAAERRKHPR